MFSPTPWSLLTEMERRLLIPKLIGVESGLEFRESESARAVETFDRAVLDEAEQAAADLSMLAPHVIEERLLTIRNFMLQTGAYNDGPLWQEIASLKGVRRSYIELEVHSRDEFLVKLGDQGFVINREPFWSIHKFDSARAQTRFSHDPSLHFANDRADEPGYGPNYFFIHWDVSSVWFEKAGWRYWIPGSHSFERVRAALRHDQGFASPEVVLSYLADQRLV